MMLHENNREGVVPVRTPRSTKSGSPVRKCLHRLRLCVLMCLLIMNNDVPAIGIAGYAMPSRCVKVFTDDSTNAQYTRSRACRGPNSRQALPSIRKGNKVGCFHFSPIRTTSTETLPAYSSFFSFLCHVAEARVSVGVCDALFCDHDYQRTR